MIDTITYLREQGIDPFETLDDGRKLWEAFDEECSALAESKGMVPVVIDRVEWHEGHGCMARIVEWRKKGIES